ncbi:MAG: 50S ribosomal protein L6 [Verrucomicrobiota bacterium]
MSRIGKQPIDLNDKVEVKEDNGRVDVKGPKGELKFQLPAGVSVRQEEGRLNVDCRNYEKDPQARAYFGLARSILQNMVIGVTDGYRKQLQVQGVGYRAQSSGKTLTLNLGFSNPIKFEVPEDVEVSTPTNTEIVVEGVDKQRVGQTAATIRAFRPPDAYKGKGVRYAEEQVTLKEGKTVG